MQTKTIKKNIQSKMLNWLETIQDEAIRKEVKDNLVVSGGSICSLFLNLDVNDYDVYIQSEAVAFKLAKYYAKAFPELEVVSKSNTPDDVREEGGGIRGVILRNLKEGQVKILMPESPSGTKTPFENNQEGKYLPVFFSPNAISLSDSLQIVLRFTGSIEEIHKSFDFVHATNYFTFKDGLVTNLKAVESILTKQLFYQGSLYPLTTIIRIKKFLNRGWKITAGEQLKVMFQISQLDLTDIATLEDQIIGVDVAYFGMLVEILKEKQDNDPNFKLSYEFLRVIIDKVFSDVDENQE